VLLETSLESLVVNRTIAICVLIAWAALFAALVAAAPWTISDSNSFLKGFVNEEFLGFMGVIVTITLASAANLYIELNKLEDKLDEAAFQRSKADVRHSAYALMSTLVASVGLVVIKPLLVCGERSAAATNGIALTILIAAIMIMIDLTQAAFSLDPRAK